ncbi:MAG: hypothetical protein WCD89_24340 [Anaerocolumna sp.]
MSDIENEINVMKELQNTADPVSSHGVHTPAVSGIKRPLRRLSKILGTAVIAAAFMVISLVSSGAVKAFAETTDNPAEYYQTIEKTNIEKQIDALTKFYGMYLDNYKKSAKGLGAQVDLKAEFDSSIAASMGLNDLKSLKATIISMQTDKKTNSLIHLFTNDKEFTSFSVLVDIEKELEYILVPELSKAYLKLSLNPDYSGLGRSAMPITAKELAELLNNNPLTEDLLNKLLKKYAAIAVGEISDVSVAYESVIAGSISTEQTQLTAKLDEKTLLTIAEKVLTAAESDKDLSDLFVKFKMGTEADYNKLIQETLKQIVNIPMAGPEETLYMNVWVDTDGNITGRDFSDSADSDSSILGYKTAKIGSDVGFTAWFNPDKEESLKLTGNLETENDMTNGEVTLSYTDSDIQTREEFNVKLEDVKYTFNGSNSYVNGKFLISGDSLPGMKIDVNCTGDSELQTMKLDFVQDGTQLVSVTMDTKRLPYEDFELPSKTEKVYDIQTQLEEYLSSANLVNYLKGINSKIDIKGINAILEQIISG